jgi:hypothetical protein
MEQPQVINTLTTKRKQIEAYITSLERDLEMARRDLSAILAATKVFTGEGPVPKSYMNLTKVFPRHVLPKMCKSALEASQSPISTKAIAAYVVDTMGLDGQDRHLRHAVAYKVIQIMRRWERECKVKRVGKVGTAVVWVVSLARLNLLK